MTVNIKNSSGTDLDDLADQSVAGNQLLKIYTSDGTDIGQKYVNATNGTAIGNIQFLNDASKDVGQLLAKKGTYTAYPGYTKCSLLIGKVEQWLSSYEGADDYFIAYGYHSYYGKGGLSPACLTRLYVNEDDFHYVYTSPSKNIYYAGVLYKPNAYYESSSPIFRWKYMVGQTVEIYVQN